MNIRALLLIVLLGGCAGQALTPDQQLAVTCRGYASTLTGLAIFKDEMNANQIKVIDEAREIINPLCKDASEGKTIDAQQVLARIQIHLRRMLLVEKGLKQ